MLKCLEINLERCCSCIRSLTSYFHSDCVNLIIESLAKSSIRLFSANVLYRDCRKQRALAIAVTIDLKLNYYVIIAMLLALMKVTSLSLR